MSNKSLVQADYPYLSMQGDPAYIGLKISRSLRSKYIKVLTIKNKKRTLLSTIKRKDGKMATNNKYKQLNHKQYGATCLLTVFAIIGVTMLLGVGVKGAVVATVLGALLFVYVTDQR